MQQIHDQLQNIHFFLTNHNEDGAVIENAREAVLYNMANLFNCPECRDKLRKEIENYVACVNAFYDTGTFPQDTYAENLCSLTQIFARVFDRIAASDLVFQSDYLALLTLIADLVDAHMNVEKLHAALAFH